MANSRARFEEDAEHDEEEEPEPRRRRRAYRDDPRRGRRPGGGYTKLGLYGAVGVAGVALLLYSQFGGGPANTAQRTAASSGGAGAASDFHMVSTEKKADPVVTTDNNDHEDNSWKEQLTGQKTDPGWPSPTSWTSPPPSNDGAQAAAEAAAVREKEKDPFTAAMTASPDPPSRAWMPDHPLYTVPAGTGIELTMQTATDSTLSGYAKAILPVAVWNESGHVRLLDAYTTVLGQIRQGLVGGLNRLFLVWAVARTPQGIRIVMNSPMADELGRAGMGGDVNNHLVQKFAPAFLFSLLTNLPNILATAANHNSNFGDNSNNSSYFQLLTPNQQLAADALRQQMNIPDTLTANQGAHGMIIAASDWDLSCCVKVVDTLERGRR